MAIARDRQLDVLRAIVSQYVQTREPVSSRSVVSSHQLDVSSATIRNDMGQLEEEGFIFQPHTSAGRVPTEAGYRLFVDRLTDMRPLSKGQKQAIQKFLDEAVDFEDVISRTVKLLAQLTHSAAMVQYPSLRRETLRRVEIVDLAPRRLMVVVVTNSGRVEDRSLELKSPIDQLQIDSLRDFFNGDWAGLTGVEIERHAIEVREKFDENAKEAASLVANLISGIMAHDDSSRIVIGGLSYLARSGNDFEDVSTVLDALEEQVALLRIISEVHTDPVQVSIGTENSVESFEQTSVVSATYRSGADNVAHLGIIGPTRMDYSRSLVAVEAVSRYLSSLLLD